MVCNHRHQFQNIFISHQSDSVPTGSLCLFPIFPVPGNGFACSGQFRNGIIRYVGFRGDWARRL